MIITRKETISSSHRLHNSNLSNSQNETIFGKCNNLHGHGHNYHIYVSVRGEIDPTTGMVMNLRELSHLMKTTILDPLDHKNLDLDVPGLKGIITTTENLAVYIWNQLYSNMSNPQLLYLVKIKETDKNSVKYFGPNGKTHLFL